MNEVTVVGIDLAKNVFELAGQNRAGRVMYRKRVRRSRLLDTVARSALIAARKKNDPLSRWMCRLADRRGHNKAVVAIANKTARILWAMMKSGESFAPARAVSA